MRLLLFRPYYGISINGDMHGDLGVCEYMTHVYPDMSLILAATIAEQSKEIEVDVIDANTEKLLAKDAFDRMGDYYDVILLKAAVPTIKYDIEFARKLKERFQNTHVVLGGHAAKLLCSWVKSNVPEIDEVVTTPIEDYVNKLINKDCNSIHVDQFPTPDYSLVPYKNFCDAYGNMRVSLVASRGCRVGCKYCPYTSFYGDKIEFRSIDKIIMDIKYILKLQIKNIVFRDQYFTANRKRIVELCQQIINENLVFHWTCETRLESLDKELIDLMVKAGMSDIFFGIESASKEELKDFGRIQYDMNKSIEKINYLNSKGVNTGAFYIIGFPDDTWETIKETYDLSLKLNTVFAKFSIYDPCMSLKCELSPDLFREFENTMNIDSCKNLNINELRFLIDQFTIIQNIGSKGFEHAYNHHYIQKKKYNEILKQITEKGWFRSENKRI